MTAVQPHWSCPDLSAYWVVIPHPKQPEQVLLHDRTRAEAHAFTAAEGFALRHFVGRYRVAQVQRQVQQQHPDAEPDLVLKLFDRLRQLGILTTAPEPSSKPTPAAQPANPQSSRFSLKPTVEWREHPDGYWILRNRDNVTLQIQVDPLDKPIIEQLTQGTPIAQICQTHQVSTDEIKLLIQTLAATGMLVGTEPAQPKRGRFHPMQLLFFRWSVFNPDPWLERITPPLHWLWSQRMLWALGLGLGITLAFGLHDRGELIATGQTMMESYGASLWVPFILITAGVVSLHELGHALTLKHYGGVVPDMGFLFMVLIPAAYTNTTDSYCLSRRQRVQVVGAGLVVQVLLAALGFWLWHASPDGSWLNQASLLLMAAGLFTVAMNLNPMAKFDGYYLAIAATGINNLRGRSFGFYGDLLQGKPLPPSAFERWVLALYAPLSLVYLWFVFGFLFWRLTVWILTNLPITAAILLILWLVYYYAPESSDSPAV
ncbi:MAG: hypothetical protein AAGG51_24090 [Cyanobacteria bacterium P01_G01_bin.54]